MTTTPITRARLALQQGDFDHAISIWLSYLTPNSPPFETYEFLQILWSLYRFADATPIQSALLTHPDTTASQCITIANRLFSNNRITEACSFTERAYNLDPNNPDVACVHASALERVGNHHLASTILNATLSHHPHHTHCIRLIAHIERLHGDLQAAIHRLQRALNSAVCPEPWILRYELAPGLEKSGQPQQALEQLLLAKQQLRPLALPHHPSWCQFSAKQWQLTSSITPAIFTEWQSISQELSPPANICFLTGFPRSGTTLLESILSTHPSCVSTDESGILASQFRIPLLDQANSADECFDELNAFEIDDISHGRAEYLRCTEEYLGSPILEHLLIEKEPTLTADLAIPLRLFPDAKILMPLRDPRDVVISYFFTLVPLAPVTVASLSLEWCCQHYANTMRHWLHIREILPRHQWLESRYEDLIHDPSNQIQLVTNFLGLQWDPSLVNHTDSTRERAISSPTYHQAQQPLYHHAKGRWQQYANALEPHMHYLTPYLSAFGYQ